MPHVFQHLSLLPRDWSPDRTSPPLVGFLVPFLFWWAAKRSPSLFFFSTPAPAACYKFPRPTTSINVLFIPRRRSWSSTRGWWRCRGCQICWTSGGCTSKECEVPLGEVSCQRAPGKGGGGFSAWCGLVDGFFVGRGRGFSA